MIKYRKLSSDELLSLEKEFVEYLILNGITAPDWEKIKSEDKEKAGQIIDLFSDVVFEGIMRKVKFLEIRTATEIKAVQCLPEKMVVVGMICDDKNADLSDPGFIARAATEPPAGLKVYTTELSYSEDREKELFEMTESGYIISDGALFKTLCLVLPHAG